MRATGEFVIAAIAVFGGYTVDGWGSAEGAVTLLGFMVSAAVTEELLFRGVLFRIVEERLGTWGALVTTGLLFGLMHLFNDNATLWGALAIAIEAGGMLGAARPDRARRRRVRPGGQPRRRHRRPDPHGRVHAPGVPPRHREVTVDR